MKFGMFSYRMHFSCKWKHKCSQEAGFFFWTSYFERFYIPRFKPKWRFVNNNRGTMWKVIWTLWIFRIENDERVSAHSQRAKCLLVDLSTIPGPRRYVQKSYQININDVLHAMLFFFFWQFFTSWWQNTWRCKLIWRTFFLGKKDLKSPNYDKFFSEVAIFRQYVPTCCQNTRRILNFSTFLLYISCNQIWLSPLVDDHQPTRHLPHKFENKTLPTGYIRFMGLTQFQSARSRNQGMWSIRWRLVMVTCN